MKRFILAVVLASAAASSAALANPVTTDAPSLFEKIARDGN